MKLLMSSFHPYFGCPIWGRLVCTCVVFRLQSFCATNTFNNWCNLHRAIVTILKEQNFWRSNATSEIFQTCLQFGLVYNTVLWNSVWIDHSLCVESTPLTHSALFWTQVTRIFAIGLISTPIKGVWMGTLLCLKVKCECEGSPFKEQWKCDWCVMS